MNIIAISKYLRSVSASLDQMETLVFFNQHFAGFKSFLHMFNDYSGAVLPEDANDPAFAQSHKAFALKELEKLDAKRQAHPELYEPRDKEPGKSLLDALYEEGVIPTYSFPKNVVSLYINDSKGKPMYQPDRGLDIAISEYAPGRAIVVDKKTYQIGGLYYGRSEVGNIEPAKRFMEDPNYVKKVFSCNRCGWFGLEDDLRGEKCPMCGAAAVRDLDIVRPWGFAPINGQPIAQARVFEESSFAEAPEYSTLPSSSDMRDVEGYINTRLAVRSNQRVVMRNTGNSSRGFLICPKCGAAVIGDKKDLYARDDKGIKIGKPYYSPKYACSHYDAGNYALGFDFITDMLVFEIAIDSSISIYEENNWNKKWIDRASRSLAEAIRLQTSSLLDIEITELNVGYRIRFEADVCFIEIYMYDSLSSGAGYSSGVATRIQELLKGAEALLAGCDCDSACQECLKHYRNRFYHYALDRHAALDLLAWAEKGVLASPISPKEQKAMISPLTRILADYGVKAIFGEDEIFVESTASNNSFGKRMTLEIFPSMLVYPEREGAIFVRDFDVKYARALAVDKIKKVLLNS
jgi:rubrerythrin